MRRCTKRPVPGAGSARLGRDARAARTARSRMPITMTTRIATVVFVKNSAMSPKAALTMCSTSLATPKVRFDTDSEDSIEKGVGGSRDAKDKEQLRHG